MDDTGRDRRCPGRCVVFAQQMFVAILGRFENNGLLNPPGRPGTATHA
ncbi:hypothetical protein [Arthrobacter sp.]